MNAKHVEELFLDYVEGVLSPEEQRSVDEHVGECERCARELREYRQLVELEGGLRTSVPELGPSFSVAVMESIAAVTEKQEQGILRGIMKALSSKQSLAGLSTVAVLSLCVVVSQRLVTENPAVLRPVVPSGEGEVKPAVQDVKTNEPSLATVPDTRIIGPSPRVKAVEITRSITVPADKSAELKLRSEIAKEVQGGGRSLTDEGAGASKLSIKRGIPNSSAKPDGIMKSVDSKSEQQMTYELPNGSWSSTSADGAKEDASVDLSLSRNDQLAASRTVVGGISQYNNYVPASPSGEHYQQLAENGRLLSRENPVSTFSIDVDTASYTNVRRMLSARQLPPADAVRIEEFLNYFDYNYPSETEKPFGVTFEGAVSPFDSARHLLQIKIKARESAPQTSEGWNLVFLVDTSGSMMDTDKLELIKTSLTSLVDRMRASDRVAIVTYAGDAGIKLNSTPGTEKETIKRAIAQLHAGGGTNGAAGIDLAYQVAQQNFRRGAVNRVILATDGDFNVGNYSFDGLMKLIEEKRKTGVTLTTIGVGTGNINDQNMEQLANKGNGNYFYFDSLREARRVLEERLTSTLEVVAKDVKLQMEFNPEVVREYRLLGYENRTLKREDFNNDAVDAGEIGTGHTVTALYEVTLVGSPASGSVEPLRYAGGEGGKKVAETPAPALHSDELGFLKIRYKEPEGESSKLLEFPVTRGLLKSSASEASVDLRFASAVAEFAEKLRNSSFTKGASYDAILSLAEGAVGEDKLGRRRELVEMVKDAKMLAQPGVPTSMQWRE